MKSMIDDYQKKKKIKIYRGETLKREIERIFSWVNGRVSDWKMDNLNRIFE